MSRPKTWPVNAWPTAPQLAEWLAVCTPEERLTHAEIVLSDAQDLERLTRNVLRVMDALNAAAAGLASEVSL